MSVPIKVKLLYKYEGNDDFTLMVDAVSGAVYVWQFCKYLTAEWITVDTTTDNVRRISVKKNEDIGDKYRCFILVDNQVKYFSIVFTLSKDKYDPPTKKKQENNNQNNSNRQSQNRSKSNNKGPSVSDTDGMDGFEFEEYCANVLKLNGFKRVRLTGGRGDYGIDILAEMNDITYAIQCKCYTGSVSNKAVQEAYSGKSFYGCMVAAVLTNSYFTPAAKETARKISVLLWDRDFLDNMIKEPFREKFNNEKHDNKQQEYHHEPVNKNNAQIEFFKGCSNFDQVKARYKKLMQTYHPDMEAGDEEYTKMINAQYEEQKKKYSQ